MEGGGETNKKQNQKPAWIWVRRPNRYNSPFLPASTPHLNSTVQMAEQARMREEEKQKKHSSKEDQIGQPLYSSFY